jgi:hypothetical protein
MLILNLKVSLVAIVLKTVSELTQQKVDAEIRTLIDSQYALAKSILEQNRDKVEAMVAALLERKRLMPTELPTSWKVAHQEHLSHRQLLSLEILLELQDQRQVALQQQLKFLLV